MQIQTTAKIEKCEIVKKGNSIKITGVKLSNQQVETMAEIINDGGQVLITIEAVQQKLPGMDVDTETGEIKPPKKSRGKKQASGDNE